MVDDYIKIEKAIDYLEKNFRQQPGLEKLASYLNVSPFHLQRMFKKWVGISPKRFLQFLTIDYAKKLLQDSRSVLETTFETGLSSPGRMHDLFVNIDAVTPGEFKNKGIGLKIDYGLHESPFGIALLGVTERGICSLFFLNDSKIDEGISELKYRWEEAKLIENPRSTKPFMDKIFPENIKENKNIIPVLLKGTNFQIKVWEALIRIPPGYVVSYEDIARAIGKPKAVRAVGNAVAANPISYIIPCHRVIRKMGQFGNYHWGTIRKKAILGWEAAQRFKKEQEPLSQDLSHR